MKTKLVFRPMSLGKPLKLSNLIHFARGKKVIKRSSRKVTFILLAAIRPDYLPTFHTPDLSFNQSLNPLPPLPTLTIFPTPSACLLVYLYECLSAGETWLLRCFVLPRNGCFEKVNVRFQRISFSCLLYFLLCC